MVYQDLLDMFTFGLIDLTSFPPTHIVCSSCTVPQPIADALQLCPPPPAHRPRGLCI